MVAKKPTAKKPVQAEFGSAKASAAPPPEANVSSAGWAHAGPNAGPGESPVVPPRPEARPPPGVAVAMGRDGKPIWRQATSNDADPYANAANYAPRGWVYEWKRYSIYNQVQSNYQSTIQRVGKWTPVQHESHPGVFGGPSDKGSIIHDGLILMERPIELHMEAKQDEQRAADEKMKRAKRERGLAPASAGVDTNTPEARAATYVQQKRALDWADDPHLREDLAAVRPAYDRNVNSVD